MPDHPRPTRTRAEIAAMDAARTRLDNARVTVRHHAWQAGPPDGADIPGYPDMISHALKLLSEREPERLPRLYQSLANGRVDDVVNGLYAYHQQIESN
ncbi:hypothetical protein [Streptomyces alboflavus]|uniref:hypothetical protein n=1 Tax=Streptomyces alboflavus TaxID=67267 RepID=UPI000F656AF7|nr:hypothetical protein [Streptomyces alboflavus]